MTFHAYPKKLVPNFAGLATFRGDIDILVILHVGRRGLLDAPCLRGMAQKIHGGGGVGLAEMTRPGKQKTIYHAIHG